MSAHNRIASSERSPHTCIIALRRLEHEILQRHNAAGQPEPCRTTDEMSPAEITIFCVVHGVCPGHVAVDVRSLLSCARDYPEVSMGSDDTHVVASTEHLTALWRHKFPSMADRDIHAAIHLVVRGPSYS
jgi:hypothetical protein